VFPDTIFLWDVYKPEDITIENLSILELYDPICETVFVGTGRRPANIPQEVLSHYSAKGFVFECTDTLTAGSTWNICKQSGKSACAILFPQRRAPLWKDLL